MTSSIRLPAPCAQVKSAALAFVVVVVLLAGAAPASAQTCYIRPLPRVGDTWHCTSSCDRSKPHAGVDFPTPSGTPVPAIADGTAVHVPSSSCPATCW